MLLVKGSLYPKRNGTEREITDFFSLATSSKIIRLFNYDCPRNWKKQSRIVDESAFMINLDSERNQVGDLICENRRKSVNHGKKSFITLAPGLGSRLGLGVTMGHRSNG